LLNPSFWDDVKLLINPQTCPRWATNRVILGDFGGDVDDKMGRLARNLVGAYGRVKEAIAERRAGAAGVAAPVRSGIAYPATREEKSDVSDEERAEEQHGA
jgi:hypothetical protein